MITTSEGFSGTEKEYELFNVKRRIKELESENENLQNSINIQKFDLKKAQEVNDSLFKHILENIVESDLEDERLITKLKAENKLLKDELKFYADEKNTLDTGSYAWNIGEIWDDNLKRSVPSCERLDHGEKARRVLEKLSMNTN